MRTTIAVAALFVLGGCAGQPSLEQLEREAMISGDWSLVERREAQLRRRELRDGVACPTGYLSVCETFGAQRRCGCVEKRSVPVALAGN